MGFDWVVGLGWVGLWVESFHFAMNCIGLGWVSRLVGLVEEIGPRDNSGFTPRIARIIA